MQDELKLKKVRKYQEVGVVVSLSGEEIPPCFIRIDRDGRWYHHGAEMIHRPFIRLFYQNLTRDKEGRYIIEWKGERCYLEVEDTPFVVRAISRQQDAAGEERFILALTDDSEEPLDPDSLFVGRANVLYCRIRSGTFRARFSRPAYYELAHHVLEKGDGFVLVLNGRSHAIRMTQDHGGNSE